MIREAVGILCTVVTLIGIVCGLGASHAIPLILVAVVACWGLA